MHQAIDFRAMLTAERLRSQTTLAMKAQTPQNVFNMLQDMRHLIILDLREQEAYDASHIRKAINCTAEQFRD